MTLTYGSVCSGIEAASVAWEPLGFRPLWFSEIEPFPCAVLKHRFPSVPNLGDMTTIAERIERGEVEAPDILVGGTPCQAFSVAGKRGSLNDERGNLSLAFVRLANAIDRRRGTLGLPPCIVVWENVPGVLSVADNAFGCLLAGLAGEDAPLEPPGGRWTDAGCVFGPGRAACWRTLDAQWFGLAQRRRRVFLVASAGAVDPSKVLLEWEGLRRDSPPCREAGKGTSANVEGCANGRVWPAEVAPTLNASYGDKWGLEDQHALGGAGHFVPVTSPIAFTTEQTPKTSNGCALTITKQSPTGGGQVQCVAFPLDTQNMTEGHSSGGLGFGGASDPSFTLGRAHSHVVATAMQVRRLTPRECERLQGFPDDWTLIPYRNKPAADGPRYKAIGNSMAIPVILWIGRRLQTEVDRGKNS